MAPFTAPTSEHQRAIGTGAGIIELVREEIRLAQLLDAERVVKPNSCGFIVGQRLLQARDALPDASRPGVHVAQRRHCDRSLSRDVRLTALRHRALEQTRGVAQLSPQGLEIRK